MKSEHESVDTKSTLDKKKICEAYQKRETEKNDRIIKMVREKPDENKKMQKKYNARGERMYKNLINRENAKITIK